MSVSRRAQPNAIAQQIRSRRPRCPPPLAEQRAIATALSDVDGLLGGLDRLIAKKRDLKQAAMQQLLSSRSRMERVVEDIVFDFSVKPRLAANAEWDARGVEHLRGGQIFRAVSEDVCSRAGARL